MSRPDLFDDKCWKCKSVVNEAPYYLGIHKDGKWWCSDCYDEVHYPKVVQTDIREKVGYYGSSFDPITYGHLWSANAILQYCHLDRITLTPASSVRIDKKINATDEQRAEMVKLAIQGNNKFTFNDYELFRAPKYEAEHTYLNLRAYKKEHPHSEPYFIMGADLLPGISSWPHAEELISENKFIVIERNNIVLHHVMYNDPMLRKYNDHFQLVYKGLVNEISSSYIRDEFKFGADPRYLMPDNVYNYIKEEGLYVK